MATDHIRFKVTWSSKKEFLYFTINVKTKITLNLLQQVLLALSSIPSGHAHL